jgi:hypothetical protein
MSNGLVEFLLARIAEDEALAQVAGERSMTWSVSGTWHLDGVEHDVVGGEEVGGEEAFCYPHNATHIAGHDPTRVLAECEAKRRIVEDWGQLAERRDDRGRLLHLFDPATSMLLKETESWIRSLASVYADHPDWRP